MRKILLASAALAGAVLLAGGADATPLPNAALAAPDGAPMIQAAQYRETIHTRRVVRPARRGCVVRITRTRTPRGVVVRKVRTCR